MKRDLRPASRRVVFILGMLPVVSACASTGATLGSGVGDRLLTRPPYYAGAPASDPAVIGAEGMLARRTPIEISAIGGQKLIWDADLETLLTARREDLPGRPLVWRTALETLATRLVGGG